jgi:hypothetical protein
MVPVATTVDFQVVVLAEITQVVEAVDLTEVVAVPVTVRDPLAAQVIGPAVLLVQLFSHLVTRQKALQAL